MGGHEIAGAAVAQREKEVREPGGSPDIWHEKGVWRGMFRPTIMPSALGVWAESNPR